MEPTDDTSSMSDDVFEDVEITQRRAEENRRRHEMELQAFRTVYTGSSDTQLAAPDKGQKRSGGDGTTAFDTRDVASCSGIGSSSRERIPSRQPPIGRYIAPIDENCRYRAVQALPHNNYDADDDDEFDDDWRSYRYDQVGMHDAHPRQQPFDDTINHKTILLGDSGVGKTSFLVKYNTGEFRLGSFSATVGIALTNKIVMVDGTKVKLQIWDTAGQERFRSVTHAYYRNAHALLLLYDVTNKNTFDNIRAWLGEIRDYAHDDVVIVLIGNKSDCNSERQVKREDGERLARDHNVPFMETSAKTGHNVELAFMAVARQLKCRGHGCDGDDGRFNVQEFVRNSTKARSVCAQCKSM